MSRLDEVEAEIADLDDSYSARTYTDGYADLARTLADEVDALRDQLARVKAESLRVVPDGEAYSMDDVYIWRCVDNMLGLYMYEKELLLCDDGTGLATPVRLERWEDE